MLIIICQDVIEKAINRKEKDNLDAIEVLKKLLLGVKWRKHIVYAPDMDEDDILQLKEILTHEEGRLLDFVHNKRQYSRDLLSRLCVLTKVTFLEDTKKDNSVIIINPKSHIDFELYEETHLIVENILDAKFYDCVICNYIMKALKLHSDRFSLAYYPVQGGGATISDVVRHELKIAQHFCIIVSDSDRKSENSLEEGDTARGIRTVFSDYLNGNAGSPFHADFYIMSKVREIENLIPFCILSLYSNNAQNDFITRYKNDLSYFDMKVGFEYRILFNSEVYEGWKRIFPDDVIDWQQIDVFKSEAIDYDDFKTKVNGMRKLVDGWGKIILKQILYPDTHIKKENQYRLFEIKEKDLTPNQKEEWDAIGKQLFSWCCCFTNPPR